MEELWMSFCGGTTPLVTALLVALAVIVLGFILRNFILGPLLKVFTSLDDEKDRARKRRRMPMGFLAAYLAGALFAFVHGTTPADKRPESMAYNSVLFVALIAFLLFVGEFVLTIVVDYISLRKRGKPVTVLIKDLLRVVIYAIASVFILKMAFPTADIGAVITASAILSIVIGLALQESLSNIFSGIILQIDKPFKNDDWIKIGNIEGVVVETNWRSTKILTRTDDVVFIPNSSVAKTEIVNYSVPTPRHVCILNIGTSYDAPPNKVRNVLYGCMKSIGGVLKDPAPCVYLIKYNDFSIDYEMRFWIAGFAEKLEIEDSVMRNIWYQFRRNDISIPFPIRDVYLRREKPASGSRETAALLRRLDILGPMSDDDIAMLAAETSTRLYATAEAISLQGEEGHTFHIIQSGKVDIVVEKEGVKTRVATLGVGAYFGEMSLLTGAPSSASVIAETDTKLLCIDRDSFGEIIERNPRIAEELSRILAVRSEDTRDKVSRGQLDAAERAKEREKEGIDSVSRNILSRISSIFRFKV